MPMKMENRRSSKSSKILIRHKPISTVAVVSCTVTEPRHEWPVVKVSDHARRTENPIRKIADALSVRPNPALAPITLNIGDPTLTGKMPLCKVAVDALEASLKSHKNDGYAEAIGLHKAREAVARHCAEPITADDVFLASGCSHALELAIVALADPGDNILVPSPGFPLYRTLMRSHGIEDLPYRLDMSRGGVVDLTHMRSLINSRTKAIVVNNPSNPTGAVYTREHLQAILCIADEHKVVVIADEIYGSLVYDGAEFIPMATLEPKVPLISCDGIGKRYLVPGWRLGWLTIHDQHGALVEVRDGLRNLTQKIVGPCSLVQGALSTILDDTPASFFEEVRNILADNARVIFERLSRVPGLKPLQSRGAMYTMVGVDEALLGDIGSFVQGMVTEVSVYCLPGSVFGASKWFRLTLAHPLDVTEEACDRITRFAESRLRLYGDKIIESSASDEAGSDDDDGISLWESSSLSSNLSD